MNGKDGLKEPPRIANRSDALELLDGMIARIGKSSAGAPPPFRGKKNAAGSGLEALCDAIKREVV